MVGSSKAKRGGNWFHNLLDDLTNAPLVHEDTLELDNPHLKRKRVNDRKSPLEDKHIYLLIALSNGLTIVELAKHNNEDVEALRDRLRQCRFHLKAKNMTHAIAIAIRQNLI